MSLEVEFSNAVLEHFSSLNSALDSELSSAANYAFDPRVKFLLFEYDSPHFSEDFTVVVWPVGLAGQVIGEGRWLLKGDVVAVPAKIYWDGKYEQIDPWAVASRLMESWIAERWRIISGSRLSVSAYIGHHDSHFKTNLRDSTQISWPKILDAHRC